MSIEPAISWRFDRPVGYLDPRATFTRAGGAYRVSRSGLLVATPANVMRPWFDPVGGRCLGVMLETQRTNILAWSSGFEVTGAWTATGLTVSTGAAVDPLGNANARGLVVTAAGGKITQAFGITAGRGIALSVFAKANKAGFLKIRLDDGTNAIDAWFNLTSGNATTTGGGATIALLQAYGDLYVNGWVRCVLEVTTGSSSVWTASISPARVAGADAEVKDSVYLYGAQAEADHSQTVASSLIDTNIGGSVTRAADNLYWQSNPAWYHPTEGTMFFEVVVGRVTPLGEGPYINWGGLGDTFSNTIYVNRTSVSQIAVQFLSSGGSRTAVINSPAYVPGTVLKIAAAWGINDTACCVNGGTVSAAASAFQLGGAAPRFGLGVAPFVSSSTTTGATMPVRAFKYIPRRLANSLLQTLTT